MRFEGARQKPESGMLGMQAAASPCTRVSPAITPAASPAITPSPKNWPSLNKVSLSKIPSTEDQTVASDDTVADHNVLPYLYSFSEFGGVACNNSVAGDHTLAQEEAAAIDCLIINGQLSAGDVGIVQNNTLCRPNVWSAISVSGRGASGVLRSGAPRGVAFVRSVRISFARRAAPSIFSWPAPVRACCNQPKVARCTS